MGGSGKNTKVYGLNNKDNGNNKLFNEIHEHFIMLFFVLLLFQVI